MEASQHLSRREPEATGRRNQVCVGALVVVSVQDASAYRHSDCWTHKTGTRTGKRASRGRVGLELGSSEPKFNSDDPRSTFNIQRQSNRCKVGIFGEALIFGYVGYGGDRRSGGSWLDRNRDQRSAGEAKRGRGWVSHDPGSSKSIQLHRRCSIKYKSCHNQETT